MSTVFIVRMRDFRLSVYKVLLENLKSKGYEIMTFREFLSLTEIDDNRKIVILRHDVDKKPRNSQKAAEIEYELGVKATYFFRMRKCSYDENIIRHIASLGHEIGYHYEDLVIAKGDDTAAIKHFEMSLEKMRNLADVSAICMHGSPMSEIDGRDLWKTYDYKNYGIIGDTYFDVDYSKMFYITDTGRMWNGHKVSRRDCVPQQAEWIDKGYVYHSTADILRAIDNGTFQNRVMITTHPQRWANGVIEWCGEFIMQNLKNAVKRIIIRR